MPCPISQGLTESWADPSSFNLITAVECSSRKPPAPLAWVMMDIPTPRR